MKRILAVVASAGLLLGAGVGLATAAQGDNNNDHGLCTAYNNGQKVGWGKQGSSPGPFQDLESRSADYTDHDGVDNDGDGQTDESGESADLSAAENVWNYCSNNSSIPLFPAPETD